ncbi:hypothetical protein BEWA_023200 [Theileria equi strain WA]|uniref:Uncharacterized protein n=1 Tax=Theileria equi strain WA TaxID=1537102 RepID=L0AWT0_THEEQ|nr:hypothetical protein BEWA_023200 [Theileria equi strain WA]AFZ79471.1 hypothetical protein BEWA_023200 [Theileria equi strain WA]|eukprot:XP_004829137.1 hypothetical protein BEWA_023200 [Theileria equi strain WA]
MTGKGVTIDIGKRPEGSGNQKVEKDTKGYYYESGKVRVNLTDDWFPDPEGTYRKLTHSLKDGNIESIVHKGSALSGLTGLESHTSVSVLYWSSNYQNPLLIQLGNDENEYYTTSDGSTWTNANINTTTLKSKLDKENCTKNGAHIINLTEKSNGNYRCPNGCKTNIQVSYNSSYGGITFYQPTIGSNTFSVTSFKDGSNWQLGLPSLKSVSQIKVDWKASGETNPLLYFYHQSRPYRYFRRSSSDSNTWIEVSLANAHPNGQTPQIPLDLSKSSGITYDGGGSKINITVLRSHIGEGYYGYQYSLRGASFTVESVTHNGTLLTGISFQGTLISVSGYYYGGKNPTDQSNILLIEVVASGNSKYSYYQKKNKSSNEWTELDRSGKRLVDEALKVILINLKKLKETLDKLDQLEARLEKLNKKLNESHNTGVLAGSSVGTGLGGAGLGALAVWKGPALIARLITRL